jgi:hypothetical protein
VDRENGSNPPSAQLDVFQWSTEYGTTINKKLKVYFGAFVGERTQAEVLDPARDLFSEDEDVEFKSNDVLVDVSKAPLPINAVDHPDLQQLPLEKLKKGLGVASQALIVNQFGDLIAYDPVSLQRAYQKSQEDLKKERKPFEELKGKSRAGGAEGAENWEEWAEEYGEMDMPRTSKRKGRRGRKNPLRRRTSSRRGSYPEDYDRDPDD